MEKNYKSNFSISEIVMAMRTEVGIYKRQIFREKKKENKLSTKEKLRLKKKKENPRSTKKKRKKTRSQPKKRKKTRS